MASKVHTDGPDELGKGFTIGVFVVLGIVAGVAFTCHELRQQRRINSLRHDLAYVRMLANHADDTANKTLEAVFPMKCAQSGPGWTVCSGRSDKPAWQK